MYKFKAYNYYNKLNLSYNILYLNYLINKNDFIIFFNQSKLSNRTLFNFKNSITNEGCVSLVLNKVYITKIFSNSFKFLSSHICCIFIYDFTKFLNIIKLLNNFNILFFYSFKKRFSLLLNEHNVLNQLVKHKDFKVFHYILFKTIFNILILILYYIIIILKYIKFGYAYI
jgi:hypothetical protein